MFPAQAMHHKLAISTSTITNFFTVLFTAVETSMFVLVAYLMMDIGGWGTLKLETRLTRFPVFLNFLNFRFGENKNNRSSS
jgi:hypothetical protein